ncbi:nicotinamide phosphoribosyltransferase [Serratia phage vB_SmaM-ChuuTotoro]|nr:nicotinamide phosphoribosyltransferase [Serratia phage vB_SmaM-ChuuTotoro]
MIHKMNPFLATDWYKPSHISMYHEKTEFIQSNYTPRSDRLFPHFTGSDHRVMLAGLQGFCKWFFIDLFERNFFGVSKEKALKSLRKHADKSIGKGKVDMSGIEAVYDLGYLPLEIRALPEGSLSPIGVPVYTVQNTVPGFGWLVNFFESVMSSETWKAMNTATTMRQFKILCVEAAAKTCDNADHLPFQCHMFAFRGEAGLADAAQSEIGHLIHFMGTDTIPSQWYAEEYYNMEDEFVAGSIPASEHSVATTNISFNVERLRKEHPEATLDELRYMAEVEFLRKFITEIYPEGFVSYVADSYDYWSMITKALPALRPEIMARDGRLVMRPDSGNPVHVICGTLDWNEVEDLTEAGDLESAAEWALESAEDRVREETEHGQPGDSDVEAYFVFEGTLYVMKGKLDWNRHDKTYYYIDGSRVVSYEEADLTIEQKGTIELLWDTFGGEVNSKGFKVLDSHIGLIYGDSITVDRATQIFKRLEAKGFASSNIVFGVGSYTTQFATRDSLGSAVKATGAIIDGVEILVSKEPKTDPGKKSAKGCVKVVKENGEYVLKDGFGFHDVADPDNELRIIFKDGKMIVDESLTQIRDRAASYLN